MTGTVNSDLIIYPHLMQTGYLEEKQDNLEVFNQSSAGALIFMNEALEGDYAASTFYKIGGTIAHRNVNSTDKVTNSKIGAEEDVSIKTPWKYGPYATTEEAFKRRGKSPADFSLLIGQDMAQASAEYFVNVALGALAAAIGSNSDMIVTGDIATDGKKVLTKGLRTVGDKFSKVAIWVMDSATYLDFVDQAIENKIFEEAGVVVYGGNAGTMGKPVLVTDLCPAYKVFGLMAGAVKITESQEPSTKTWDINDEENLSVGYRGEGVVNVEVLGYKWKTKTSINPSLSVLSNSSNWVKNKESNKSTAGFVIDLTPVVEDAGA